MDENKTFFEENIKNNSVIYIHLSNDMRGAGPIDNLMNENAKNIGFDMNLIKEMNYILFNLF